MNISFHLKTGMVAIAAFMVAQACAKIPLVEASLAQTYQGVEFSQGNSSFADRVVQLDYHESAGVAEQYADGTQALGAPDEKYVSLGNVPKDGRSSSLVVEFVDNRLVDVAGPDLYVFEIGPKVEATTIAISVDGQQWFELGRIEGSTRAIDLKDYPTLPQGAKYRFVRLQDFPDGKTSPSPYAGPDIDAIGAIGSVSASENPSRPSTSRPGHSGSPACQGYDSVFTAIGKPQFELRFKQANASTIVPHIAKIVHSQRQQIAQFDYSVGVGYPNATLQLQNSEAGQVSTVFPIYFFEQNFEPAYGDINAKYAVISGFAEYDYYNNAGSSARSADGLLGDVMWKRTCSK